MLDYTTTVVFSHESDANHSEESHRPYDTLFWFLLTLAIWQFHPSSIAELVPLHRIPWISNTQIVGGSLGKNPRPPLSNGHWIRALDRMNDTLIWDIKRGCLEPSSLAPGHVRSTDVDAWEWILSGNERLAEFDIERFVIRALQSRIGYVLVGDSLTEGITTALEMMLLMPSPAQQPRLVDRKYEWGWTRWAKQTDPTIFSWNMTLQEHHSLTKRIIARWESGDEELQNIPLERFKRPIVRMFRSSNLASEEEIGEVLERQMGLSVNWTETLRIPTPWRERIRLHAEDRGWQGEKSSIVLMNTGPHWEPARFGRAISELATMQAYKLVVGTLWDPRLPIFISVLDEEGVRFISVIPSDLPVRIMYRSTMPGHEYCSHYHYPVTVFDAIAKDPTPTKKDYHYHWFPEFNTFAKDLWGSGPLSPNHKGLLDEEENTAEWRDSMPKRVVEPSITTEYWDIWNMTVTRPDAHVDNNGRDCLHFCPAGVYYWVVRAWWDTIAVNGY